MLDLSSLRARPKSYPRTVIFLFALAVSVQVIFLALLPGQMRRNEDTDYLTFYKPVGESILAGRGFVNNNGTFASRYPPGYPAIVAFAFGMAHRLRISQEKGMDAFDVLAMAANGVLAFLIANLLFGGLVPYAAFLLWIFYPANLWLIKQPNSEVPFMFLLFGAVLLFLIALMRIRSALALASGFALGAAALIRPIGVFLPLVFACTVLFFREIRFPRRIEMAAFVCIGFLVSVAPWEGLLHYRTGQFPLLCTNGPATVSEGLVFAVEPIAGAKPMWVPGALSSLMDQAMIERPSMKSARDVFTFLAREASRNPVGMSELLLMKAYRPWYSTYSRRYDRLNLIYQLCYVPLGMAGIVLAALKYHSRAFWIIFLGALMLYFWAMAFLVVPLFRYMTPPMTFLVIFGAVSAEAAIARMGAFATHSPADSIHPSATECLAQKSRLV